MSHDAEVIEPGGEAIPLPRCPHCATDMPGVALYSWAAPGPTQILAAYCPNFQCRKLLHMQIVLLAAAHAEESRVLH